MNEVSEKKSRIEDVERKKKEIKDIQFKAQICFGHFHQVSCSLNHLEFNILEF